MWDEFAGHLSIHYGRGSRFSNASGLTFDAGVIDVGGTFTYDVLKTSGNGFFLGSHTLSFGITAAGMLHRKEDLKGNNGTAVSGSARLAIILW